MEVVRLPADGATVLLCSDGVWDALGMHECATIARSTNRPDKLAHLVTRASVRNRGLRNDTTCIAIVIGRLLREG